MHELSRKKKDYDQICQEKGRVTAERLARMGEALSNLETAWYNAQPIWSIRHIRVNSRSEATEVVKEFLRMVRFTSTVFCWPLNCPVRPAQWEKHGWKHISFAELRTYVDDMERGWEPTVQTRADLIGSTDEVQRLFKKAASKDPAAVARIDALFPREEEKKQILDDFFASSERPTEIPSAADLAAELAGIAIGSPDSKEAEQARRASSVLVSKRAAKGGAPQGGRPPGPYPDETILLLYKMSYALNKQLREVQGFLKIWESPLEKRNDLFQQLCPWVSEIVGNDLQSILESRPAKAACHIAGAVFGISASKVEKTLDKHRALL